MSLESYSHERGQQFHSCGGTVTSHETEDLADGAMLWIEATIVLAIRQEAVLEVGEVVIETDTGAHRERYNYRFIFEGLQIFGYDRDAKNHPDMPEHKHIGDRRIAWGPVTFQEFVDEVWEWINERRDDIQE